jgi:hypothetical protein
MQPKDDEQFTLAVPEAGAQAGLSKNASYRAAKLGQIPTIKLGRKLRVPALRWKHILQGREHDDRT